MKALLSPLIALMFVALPSLAKADGIWVKSPNFSNMDFENTTCYEIDMAYFNNCTAKTIHAKPLLSVDKKGNITRVDNLDTGSALMNHAIRYRLKATKIKPFTQGGEAVAGAVTLPINLLAPEMTVKEAVTVYDIDSMRKICAGDDKCDNEQLERLLIKEAARMRATCGDAQNCGNIDSRLKEKSLYTNRTIFFATK